MNRTNDSLKVLENESLIRGLAASFADACTHGDAEQFARLWTEDGVWKLGVPLSLESKGKADNLKLFSHLGAGKRFFCQMLHSGVVAIVGETATARWILSESAAGQDGSSYRSLATYDDRLVYQAGGWLFLERSCKFLDISDRQ